MTDKSYVLLFDSDLITSSILTLSIKKKEALSRVYFTQDSITARRLIEVIAHSPIGNHILNKEIIVIVDLNIKNNEGCFFLDSQLKSLYPITIKYFTVKNEGQGQRKLPYLPQSLLSGELEKPVGMEEIEKVLFPEKKILFGIGN